MLPHTHIKLPAWISAANSSLLRQQKRNTVIFIILHVAVSRRQSQNIFGWLLLENLINQLCQLRWEKLGILSLQYIFFLLVPLFCLIQSSTVCHQGGALSLTIETTTNIQSAIKIMENWAGSRILEPLNNTRWDNRLFFAFENTLALSNVGWLQKEQCLLYERLFPLYVCVSTIFHDLYLRHGERKNWMHIKLAAFV